MSNYPLIDKMGLKVDEWSTYFSTSMGLVNGPKEFNEHKGNVFVISADDLERKLSEAPVVTGMRDEDGLFSVFTEDPHNKAPGAQYRARLIMIEPIQKDTPESLLREWVDHDEKMVPQLAQTDFIQRARKLLGESK